MSVYNKKFYEELTVSILLAISTFLFLLELPFLTLVFIIVIPIAIFLLGIYRNTLYATGLEAFIVIVSVIWQSMGFISYSLSYGPGLLSNPLEYSAIYIYTILLLIMIFIILLYMVDPVNLSIGVLSSALTLTPAFFLSPILIIFPKIMNKNASIYKPLLIFLSILSPLLYLNALIAGPQISFSTVAFYQLFYLSHNLRPSITSINVFISGFPPNYAYPKPIFVGYPLSKSIGLVEAIILYGIAYYLSYIISTIIIKLFVNKIYINENIRNLILYFNPAEENLILILFFIAFLLAFSAQLNGLLIGVTIFSTLILGVLFSFLSNILGSQEVIFTLRTDLQRKLQDLSVLLKKGMENLSLINISTENTERIRLKINECYNLYSSISNLVQTANERLLRNWNKETEECVKTLSSFDETFKKILLDEINNIRNIISLANNVLKDIKLEIIIPETQLDSSSDMSQVINEYKLLISNLRKSLESLYNLYMENAKAFNKLMGIEQAPLDVPNPVIRLDRGDLEGAVKIITDYWYKFDNIHRVEFKEKIDKLSKVVIELIETLSYWGNNEDYLDKLKQIVKDLENSSPSNAIHILNNLRNIMKICDEIIEKVNKEIEDINKISSEYKQFEFKVPTELKLLNNLKIRQDFNTIEEYISFISDISAFLKRHIDYLKQDEQQLLIISLYPLGDYIISKLLEEDKEVYLDELPFTKPVANLYAKLYSILHNNVKYDEDKEVIKYANM
ncbi:MAG: hypothetical protein RRA45_00080 [Saccharolobus sp.]|jgi:exonuclease VII small subunit|uniref:hypothetical protein n=1 Tax=Saccharolobus sp. TaxID=2100761 RepID=UPI0028CBDA8A|nr:hypothetical protein [Saccharolobus sp.]MDT7860609.1 hypothetical protein [Saccharolobus sp.]